MARQKRPIRTINPERAAALEQQGSQRGDGYVLGALNTNEELWVTYYDYLLEHGYQLRPRLRPGWVRSWKGTNLLPADCEDSWSRHSKLAIDAVRLSDGKQVMIKKMLPSTDDSGDDGQKELRIVQYLSSPTLQSDRRNHAMPYLDSFPIPDISEGTFLVSPLYVEWDKIPLETINQAIDFVNQLLEASKHTDHVSWKLRNFEQGLAFLHEHRIAHRDCTPPNIMMDWSSLVDEPFHPIYNVYSLDGEYELDIRNRSQGNVRYYFIDFGLSTWFENQDTPTLVTGQDGREQNAPELHAGKPYDPFKVDIFILGAFLERDLVKEFHGLEFLEPLLRQMTSQTPDNRPTATQAAQYFGTLARKVPPRNLSWPMISRKSGIVNSVTFAFNGFINRSLNAVNRMFRRGPGMM